MPRPDCLFRLLHALRTLPQPVTAARLAAVKLTTDSYRPRREPLLREFLAQLRARPQLASAPPTTNEP